MKKYDFRRPAQCPPPPWPARLKAGLLIGLQQRLPLRWSMRLSLLGRRVEAVLHPRRRRRLAKLLRPIRPEERSLAWCVRMAMLVRQMGTRTYAGVAGRERQWLMDTLRPEGLEGLEELRGEGAIVLGTHAGMTAWVPPALIQLGFPMRLTHRKRVYPQTLMLFRRDGWIDRVADFPAPGQEAAHLKGLHDLLRRGEWIQHTGDYPDRRGGVGGEFLGFRVRCRRAPWALGRSAGAPLVPALVVLEADLRPRLIVGAPIRVAADGPADRAIEEAFGRYLSFLETHLRPRPWNLYVHLLAKSRVSRKPAAR